MSNTVVSGKRAASPSLESQVSKRFLASKENSHNVAHIPEKILLVGTKSYFDEGSKSAEESRSESYLDEEECEDPTMEACTEGKELSVDSDVIPSITLEKEACVLDESLLNSPVDEASTDIVTSNNQGEITIASCSTLAGPLDDDSTHDSELQGTVNTGTSDGETYSCTSCSFQTARRLHFLRHLRKHSEEKPFACDSCDYRASTMPYLRRHQRTHKDNQREKDKDKGSTKSVDGLFGVDGKYEVLIESDEGASGPSSEFITTHGLIQKAHKIDSALLTRKFRAVEQSKSSVNKVLKARRSQRSQPLKHDQVQDLEERTNKLEQLSIDERFRILEARTAKMERLLENILTVVTRNLESGVQGLEGTNDADTQPISAVTLSSLRNDDDDNHSQEDDTEFNEVNSEEAQPTYNAEEILVKSEPQADEESIEDPLQALIDEVSLEVALKGSRTQSNETTNERNDVAPVSKEGEIRSYACNQCGYRAKRKQSVLRHKQIHKVVGTLLYPPGASGEPYSCSECQYTTTNITYFRKHKKNHLGEKQFACSQCNYRAHRKYELEYHLKIHSGVKPFACTLCDYRCTRKFELQYHQRRHTGEKPFACDQCSFTSRTLNNLQQHKRTHSGEKPFACEYCDYRASAKNLLKYHTRKHTGYKPFHCKHCDYRANSISHLNFHMKSHTGEKPYACTECSYRAKSKHQLTVHSKTHTGEKPFECDVCEYRTARRDYLKRHRELHTVGGRQFSCNMCEYKTPSREDLRSHKAAHAEEHSYCVIIEDGEFCDE